MRGNMILFMIWAVLFGAGFYYVFKRGVTANIFFEIFYACLFAGRVMALVNGECYRLSYEWEGYIFRWTVNVILILILLVLGAVTLHMHKRKPEFFITTLFCLYSLAALMVSAVAWEFYWRHL